MINMCYGKWFNKILICYIITLRIITAINADKLYPVNLEMKTHRPKGRGLYKSPDQNILSQI